MENNENTIESLIDRAEKYGKTSIDLLKLKSVDKTGNLVSAFLSQTLLYIFLIFFIFILTVSAALWLGELLGKNYYGFLVVAGFYGLVTLILLIIRPSIKKHFKNAVINHLLN